MALTQAAVEELLAAASAAVDAANIPEDLRPIAFTKALDMLAGATSAPAPGGGGGEGSDKVVLSDDERMNKIATKVGADATKLPYVYDLDEEDVAFSIQRSKLSSTDAAATREVALLYCAARQALGLDTQTKIELIRTRVEDMGVYDGKNFSTHLKSITGVTVKGKDSAREYKVTAPGFEEAGKLITRLTGGGS